MMWKKELCGEIKVHATWQDAWIQLNRLGAQFEKAQEDVFSRLWEVNVRGRRPILSLLVVAALSLLAGCRPHTDRLAISGRVTLDGVPLDRGSIRLSSTDSQQLMASGAMIRDGQYTIPEEKGLVPGTYRVQITSPDLNAPPVMHPATANSPSFPVPPERIPPEYNVDSKQTVEVTADGDNLFVFDIVTHSAG